MPQFHQSCVRASCVRPAHQNTSFDTFSSIFPPQTAPVPAFHSPVPHTAYPPQRTLCAGAFVSQLFVSRAPSLHHLHAYTAFSSQSPRGQSLNLSPPRVQWRMRSHDRFFYCALVHDHLLTHTTPLLARRSPSPLAPPHSKPNGCLYPHQYPPQSSFSTHNPSTAAPLIAPGAIT